MHAVVRAALAALVVVPAFASRAAAQAACSSEPLAVQVLGSGGPNAGGTRASSGYLVWRDGRAVALVDAGGGTFLRFGEAGARLQDLSLVAISHLHPDHVSDLPALLWLSELARQQPLVVAGPTGAGAFPSIEAFLARLFDAGSGAFPILGGTLGQPGQGVRLEVLTADATVGTASTIWSGNGLEVSAIGVPHGNVPTLAYRLRIGDRTVVFGSDQNAGDERFAAFAAGADLLIMHFGLSARAPDPIARVHARPAAVGQAARMAHPGHLVLSHLMEAPSPGGTTGWFSLSGLDDAVGEVRAQFPGGRIDTATDLQCIPIR
jgi:ribonuclease BN (tRNA processing enzyme)